MVANCFALPVPTVEIAPGVHMPLVFQGAGSPKEGTTAEETVRKALEVGYVAFDTAAFDSSYDDIGVAAALRDRPRNSFFITTKINSVTLYDPAQTREFLDEALHHLGLEYVDLMLVHGPGQWANMTVEASLQQQWAKLEEFYRDGKARAIGVSNYCVRAMKSVLKTASVTPHVNQVIYHAGMGEDPEGVITFARAHNITIQAESPTDWANPRIMTGEPYKSIAAKHGKTGLQVALRWLVQRNHSLIVGAHSKKHMVEDLDIFDFVLTQAELANVSLQNHCRAGFHHPPFCNLTSFPSPRRCCDTDGRGTQCPNWGDDAHESQLAV